MAVDPLNCQAHSRLAHSTLANMSASPKTACRTLKKSPAGHTDVQDCTGERKKSWKYNLILTTARRWGLPKQPKNVRANRHDDDDDDDDDDDGDGDGDEMMKMMTMVWLLVPWEWASLKKKPHCSMVNCSFGVGDFIPFYTLWTL